MGKHDKKAKKSSEGATTGQILNNLSNKVSDSNRT